MAFVTHYFRVGSARPFIFSAAGVMGIGVLVFRLKTDKGAITHDERDKLIEKNAHLAGFGVVYLLVILVSFIPLGIAPEAKIPTKWFPGLLIGAVFCQGYAQSLAILIQYGWRGKDGEK